MAVLFDLDGTLLDTVPDFVFVINQLRKAHSLPLLAISDIRPSVSAGMRAMVSIAFPAEKENVENEALLDSLVEQTLKIYSENISKHTIVFPGIMALLDTLEARKTPWGIVTNKPGFLTKALLEDLRLYDRAACVVSGDTTARLKPAPDSLLYACKTIGIEPGRCIYIGDALQDIQAGKAANMKTVAALYGYINKPEEALKWEADYMVSKPQEILAKILEWESNLA